MVNEGDQLFCSCEKPIAAEHGDIGWVFSVKYQLFDGVLNSVSF
jgi:hypothetical protein